MNFWKILFIAAALLLVGCAPKSMVIGNQEWTLANPTTFTWNEAQSACPAGFHIPHLVELETMEKARRSDNSLKPIWCFGSNGNTFENGLCYSTNFSTIWTNVEDDKKTAYVWDLELDYAYFKPQAVSKRELHSILCAKD